MPDAAGSFAYHLDERVQRLQERMEGLLQQSSEVFPMLAAEHRTELVCHLVGVVHESAVRQDVGSLLESVRALETRARSGWHKPEPESAPPGPSPGADGVMNLYRLIIQSTATALRAGDSPLPAGEGELDLLERILAVVTQAMVIEVRRLQEASVGVSQRAETLMEQHHEMERRLTAQVGEGEPPRYPHEEEGLRTRRERYERAVRAANVGLWDWNLETNEIYLAPELKALIGYQEDEELRPIHHWSQCVHPDDREKVRAATQAHLRGDSPVYEMEHRIVHRSGDIRWIASRGMVIRDGPQQGGWMSGTSTDITERKQVEHALRESEARYRAVVEDQTDLICRFRPDGTLTFVNDAYCRYFGKQREDLLSPGSPSIIPATDQTKARKYLAWFHPANAVATTEHRVITPEGEVRWQQWTDRAIFDGQGNLVEFQSVGRDITDRVRAEQSLKVQRDLAIALSSASGLTGVLHQVLHTILQLEGIDSGGIYLVDWRSGNLDLVFHQGFSRSFVRCIECYPAHSFQWQRIMEGEPRYGLFANLVPPRDPSCFAEGVCGVAIIPVLNEGKVVASLNLASHVHEHIPVSTCRLLEIIATQIGGAIARVKAETALQESRNNFQTLFDTMDDFLFIFDASGRIIQVNPVVEQRLGYSAEELASMHLADVHLAEQRGEVVAFIAAMVNGTAMVSTVPLMAQDGTTIPVETRVTRGTWGNQSVLFGISRDITELKQAEDSLLEANEQLHLRVRELQRRNHDIILLNRMGEFLQSCLNTSDVFTTVEQFAGQLFAHQGGALYIMHEANHMVEAVSRWGTPPYAELMFATEECWALRRGRSHIVGRLLAGPRCQHIRTHGHPFALCMPLIAQSKILGVLHLRSDLADSDEAEDRWIQLATMMAEQVAMALANLRLREQLQDQAIRDALTGLYNRRYLDDTLVRELHRAARHRHSVGVIMLDIDHFKRFNDRYGHDAGDAMLMAVGEFLQTHVRREDIACRYGGEEFTLILPDTSLPDTLKRAEELLAGARELQIRHKGRSPGAITLSFGVACCPEHGRTADEVIRAADTALLRAKETGRDRVVVAQGGEEGWQA
ncbi:MAG: PAS domain S-box protein [Chloroflexaceae bacterium]|nr:PAS domain S-box protein [Chloroflexaceae bacterium]